MRTVVITGASSGLGLGLAKLYAGEGCRVALLARRVEDMRRIAEGLPGGAERHLAVACDVTDDASVKAAFAAVEAAWGTPDLLIANAGLSLPMHSSRNWGVERVKRQFDTNVLGLVRTVEAVLPGMMARKSGQIVAVSSVAGLRAFPGNGAYCASKAAVNSLMESLRLELLPHGIAVTTLCPGFVKTPLVEKNRFPMPFILEVDDACRLMHAAIAAKKALYAFPWQTRWLARLSRFVPGRLIAGMKTDVGARKPAAP